MSFYKRLTVALCASLYLSVSAQAAIIAYIDYPSDIKAKSESSEQHDPKQSN